MAITTSKRKKMEDLIYNTFALLDTTGANTRKYKELFKSMSDAQFDSYFKKFFASEFEYLTLDIADFERDVRMADIEKAAKYLKLELYEYVALPYQNMNRTAPIVTKFKVPVGPIHIKRLQQLRAKKNTTSTETNIRSATTGQVSGKDKNARDNDGEAFSLITIGAEQTLREMFGPRGDDLVMQQEMDAQIAMNGYVDLDKITNKVENKTTLNTIDTYFICMGFKSDLVTDGLLLKKTLKD